MRDRWELIFGESKVELPKLLKRLDKVDIFYHDSEHTYENMMFEFKSVWPKIKKDGFLISDDYKWNQAFDDFLEIANNREVYTYRSVGIIRK